MKKLIVLASVVCAAMFANAASLNWKVVTGAGTTGLDIFICATIAEFESAADISSHLLGTEGNTATSAAKGARTNAYIGNTDTVGGIADSEEGSGKSYYAVVVSADGKGYWAMAGSGEIYTTATEPALSTIDMASTISGTAYTPWKTSGGGTDPSGVPEPTSGLLLLVGGAMLALRRKQK